MTGSDGAAPVELETGPAAWRTGHLRASWFLFPVAAASLPQVRGGEVLLPLYALVWLVELGRAIPLLRVSAWLGDGGWGRELARRRPRRSRRLPPRTSALLFLVTAGAWTVLWVWLLWTRGDPRWAVVLLAGFAALAAAEVRAWLLAERARAWLTGSVLRVRGIRTVASCDLAANPVNLTWTRTGLPVLHCPTGAGGRRLAVRLWRVAGTGEPVVRALPGPQLQALADALGPPAPSRQAAHDVLTAMAAGGLPVKGNLGGNRPSQP